MIKINYYSHLLLNSKYRLFIHLFVLLLIYLCIYSDNILYCMNESTDAIPSPKRARVPALAGAAKEIEDYIVPLASMQEELAQARAELKETREALRAQEDIVISQECEIYNLKAKVRQVKTYRNMHRYNSDENEYYLSKYRERFGFLSDIQAYNGPDTPYSDLGSELGEIPDEFYESGSTVTK